MKPAPPIIGKLLEYSGLKKLLSTYIDALPELINPQTGKIHTSFNQAVTSTGRLSSTNPNLQNIPVRDDLGREIRKAFIPDNTDCLFFSADCSQIELRIMAHLSGDPHMIEAFQSGADIRRHSRQDLRNPVEEVTSDMRRKAKPPTSVSSTASPSSGSPSVWASLVLSQGTDRRLFQHLPPR